MSPHIGDEDDDDEDDINNIFSPGRVESVAESNHTRNQTDLNTKSNAISKGRVKSMTQRQASRGSILGPRAMTATFGSSRHGNPSAYEMDPFGGSYHDKGGRFNSRGDGFSNGGGYDASQGSGPYVHLGDYDINGDLDQLRDSTGLMRAKSSGPGIVSNGFKPSSQAILMERERGRGPRSLEARQAAAHRYNSSDALNKTKF